MANMFLSGHMHNVSLTNSFSLASPTGLPLDLVPTLVKLLVTESSHIEMVEGRQVLATSPQQYDRPTLPQHDES